MTMEADLMTMTMEADLMTMTMEADVMTKIIEEDLMTMEADVMTMDDLMKKARKRIKLMSEKEIQLVLKESEKMRPRIKQMSDKEMLLVLNESREKRKGLITKYPRFIPPPKPDLPPLTPHQQDMLLEDLLSHPKDNYLQYDTCRDPAQTPAELSEEDDRAIQILYEGLEATRRKKILGESISKQKNKAASSSRNQ